MGFVSAYLGSKVQVTHGAAVRMQLDMNTTAPCLEALDEVDKPALFRVELVIDGQVIEEETVVRTPSTYEGTLTNRNYRRRAGRAVR
jgi:hypothetical protein